MAGLAGSQILKISISSLVFFIIILVSNLYFYSSNGVLKPIMQAIIATVIYFVGLYILKKKSLSSTS